MKSNAMPELLTEPFPERHADRATERPFERPSERVGLSQNTFAATPNRPPVNGAKPDRFERKGKVLSAVMDEKFPPVGVVGSPSDTSEITIDILEASQADRIRGQMVYLVMRHADAMICVMGQISRVETKNRWHEDMAFRGIIKRQGSLPHLSERADVRSATLTVQAAFAIDKDEWGEEFCEEDMLGTSPGTGAKVFSVRDEVLTVLLAKYAGELVYMGNVYGTKVKMPFTLRHFGKGDGGAGEAYHIGVFGKTGSGKSGLAAYMLFAYARHRKMGVLFIDPQSQFTEDKGLPFPLHKALASIGRDVKRYQMATQVRLKENVPQFCSLLKKVGFYTFLTIRADANTESAEEVVGNCVRKSLESPKAEFDAAPPDLLKRTLETLITEPKMVDRIYSGKEQRERLSERVKAILADEAEFADLQKRWTAVLDLFQKVDSKGRERVALWGIVGSVINAPEGGAGAAQPIVFLDINVGSGDSVFKDDEEIKALILREIAQVLNIEGDKAFKQNRQLNVLVALDEAHRFVKNYTRSGDDSEMANLTKSFVDAVRTTRKYGLGYMFITQSLASLHREIIGQLRLNAFGYGLTAGTDLASLEELVGDKEALSLYRSFVDPQSRPQYPFMFTGPASPLSFTGMPLFVQMFTSFRDFCAANGRWTKNAADEVENAPKPVPVVTTERGFGSAEAFDKARSADFD